VNVDLAGSLGSVTGDGAVDRVAVNGSKGTDDNITAAGDASGVVVTGLQARVAVQHQEPTDQLAVDGLAGDDDISATALAAQTITTSLDGDSGNDRIAGGPGNELLFGGFGNDSIDGNGGSDIADLGADDDTFVWDPGDGSDTIEGQDGNDTMVFNGAAAAEQVDLSANGNRLRFFRSPANITMDTHGVENVDFNALGGADLVTVNDLSGTGVQNVNVDLAGSLGGVTGDGAADRVVVNGTNGNDRVTVSGAVQVRGLPASVAVLHSEAANDRLEINTLAGSDDVDSSRLTAGAIQLLVNGVPAP
jgi:Ca2+-binding RTX toxin-like protein